MIFVLTGMDAFPIDRLARAVDGFAGAHPDEEVFLQLGSCTHVPEHARWERFLPLDRVREEIRRSTVVVTHAGAGSMLVCLEEGKHPVVVPRRADLGEIVDGHQVPFARRLEKWGLATVLEDVEELPAAIATARARGTREPVTGQRTELTSWLETFWRDLARKSTDARAPVRRIGS